MLALLNLFKKKKEIKPAKNSVKNKNTEHVANRKGEIGEYKIDIQLSQLPKEYKYLNDLMIENTKTASGFSQIDHVVLTPYGIFVIETKNYQGSIYGGRNRKTWLINGKFKMPNPLIQNYGHIQALKRFVDKKFHRSFLSLVSFTKRCNLKIDLDLRDIHSEELVIYDLYLTETILRKVSMLKLKSTEAFLSQDEILAIYETLAKANITDPKIRKMHVDSIIENNTKKDSKSKCAVCNKPVSQKVVDFCSSKKEFKGKIYCYEHQK
ncbi:NERD nuclease [Virgibacillus indicus]|uniref:NERD nuclease n=1 Tax=Virgibacillus indicus TaxID=2024554 RepID=A0A265NCV0_9BACI|nr:nuclease-related domain-containing protein [Virgibacillus indicus]OZU89637.1 NERD nuclease [Virgibacillus indicus]